MFDQVEDDGRREPSLHDEIKALKAHVAVLREALEKATTHVRPTCFTLYEELTKVLASTQDDSYESLTKDAERYRVLLDHKYQLDEDDPCVSDSFFNSFYEEELDAAVDALKVRFEALAEIGEK